MGESQKGPGMVTHTDDKRGGLCRKEGGANKSATEEQKLQEGKEESLKASTWFIMQVFTLGMKYWSSDGSTDIRANTRKLAAPAISG